jgi:hypothetical protein
MLSSDPRSIKQWKQQNPPAGWNSPDPMPGTLSRDLEARTRRELESRLCEVEKAIGLATDRFHDEAGLKAFARYFGAAILGGMGAYAVPAIAKGDAIEGSFGILVVGGIALCSLVYGFMSQRSTDRTIIIEARKHDRDRLIRALDRAKK